MIVEYEGKRLRPHELVQILEHARPTCRACGGEMSRGRDLCPMCEPGYELAIADFVALVDSHGDDPAEALRAIRKTMGLP